VHTRSRARVRASALIVLLLSVLGSLAVSTPADASTWRSQVPGYAANFRGDPYHWGSAGPNRFDCSGYTLYVFRHFGKSLPHSSAQQYSSTHHIAKNEKQPGDLLFFRSSKGRVDHVGIYAGDGRFIHAPNAGSVVSYAYLDAPYYRSHFVGAGRF
jgi:cell wall-associated NlpC family hydrolase